MLAELVTFAPASDTVPGSPAPLSRSVPCQGVEPRMKPVLAEADTATMVPVATQTDCDAAAEAVPEATVTVHQASKLSTVRRVPLQPPSPPSEPPPLSPVDPESPASPPLLPLLLLLEDEPELLPDDEPLLPLDEEEPLLPEDDPLLEPVAESVPPPSSPTAPLGLLEELQPAARTRAVARAPEKTSVSRVDFMVR
jgi:hypothetical protein